MGQTKVLWQKGQENTDSKGLNLEDQEECPFLRNRSRFFRCRPPEALAQVLMRDPVSDSHEEKELF